MIDLIYTYFLIIHLKEEYYKFVQIKKTLYIFLTF